MVKSFPDQKEYLKKYLSGHKEKKLKKKSVNVSKGVKLIDDDESMKPVDLDEDDIFLHGEEAPQIVLGDGVDSSALQDGFKKWKSISAVQIKGQEKTKFLNNFSALNSPSTSNFNEDQKICDLNQRKSNEKDTISKHKYEKFDHSSKNKINYSNDLSPPRSRNKAPSPITTKLRRKSNDFSPERKNFKKRDRSEDLSPLKRKKNSSSSDLSPERTKTGGKSKFKDSSPCKYRDTKFMSQISTDSKRSSSRSDLSQRKRTSRWDNVQIADESQYSAEMPKRRSSSSDQSPQRKTDFQKRNTLEFPAVGQKTSTNTDRSTRRSSSRNLSKCKTDLEKRSRSKDYKSNSRKRDNSNGLSLNRKRSLSSDLSPQRKQFQKNSSPIKRKETHNSPKKHYKNNSRSRSRTRSSNTKNRNEYISTKQNSFDLSPPRFSEKDRKKDENRITKMADGKTSGLRNAKDLQEDLKDLRAKELEMLKDTSIQAGRFAEPVIRSHARYKPESLENQIKNKKKEEENEKRQEVYNRWGKGLKQIEDHKAKVVDQEYESSKPLARYADDQDLDKMLKQVEREGDPMLNYLRSKKEKDRVNKKQPEKPIYKGSYPENRYGIRPGYRWDGVDRSNGYEKKYFEKQNSKRALEEEAYRYSTEDM